MIASRPDSSAGHVEADVETDVEVHAETHVEADVGTDVEACAETDVSIGRQTDVGKAGPRPASSAAAVPPPRREPATEADLAVVAEQLGRRPRGTRAVAHRCACGLPDVVETTPRLADGTPFPTLFYLTCPRATAACSRLESAGVMREMAQRLVGDPELAARYRAAHEDYLRRREAIGQVPEIAGISAGGMPGRVKCLHVHLGHALGAGPGVNPFGDEVLERIEPWWTDGPCVRAAADTDPEPSKPIQNEVPDQVRAPRHQGSE